MKMYSKYIVRTWEGGGEGGSLGGGKTVEEGKSLLPIPSVKRRRSHEFLDLKGKFEKNENPENCDKTTSTFTFSERAVSPGGPLTFDGPLREAEIKLDLYN
jgi:hypothetical protein